MIEIQIQNEEEELQNIQTEVEEAQALEIEPEKKPEVLLLIEH